jgi:hypothetical protein
MFRDSARGSFANEFEEHENEFHTDKLNEEEKFAKMFYTTNFDFEENEKFDMRIDIANGSFTNKFEEQATKFLTDKFEQNTDNQKVQCPVLRGGCN